MAEMTPGGSTPDSVPRTRRVLLHQGIDVLLILLMLAGLAKLILDAHAPNSEPFSSGRDLVNREDRWRFEAMPASDDGLLAWSRSQPDLRNFRVERVPADNQLVLRYELIRARGPAHPDWDLLGYRMAYLVSAPSLQTTQTTAGSSWISLMDLLLLAGLLLRARRRQNAAKLGSGS